MRTTSPAPTPAIASARLRPRIHFEAAAVRISSTVPTTADRSSSDGSATARTDISAITAKLIARSEIWRPRGNRMTMSGSNTARTKSSTSTGKDFKRSASDATLNSMAAAVRAELRAES